MTDFWLENQDNIEICLRDFRGSWVILYFYPKDFTPGCTTEARDFSDLLPDFEALGATILGVSPDESSSHCGFIEKNGLKITLLSDPDTRVARAFGAYGVKKLYGKESEGIIRSTFIINPKGEIVREWKNVRTPGHAQRVLDALKELQKS